MFKPHSCRPVKTLTMTMTRDFLGELSCSRRGFPIFCTLVILCGHHHPSSHRDRGVFSVILHSPLTQLILDCLSN
jgi:hypothetical protein